MPWRLASTCWARHPRSARCRLDDRRTADLITLAGAVDVFWTRHQRLPASLDELRSEPVGRLDLQDPSSGRSYEYRALAERSYEVCAVFERDSAAARPPGSRAACGRTGPGASASRGSRARWRGDSIGGCHPAVGPDAKGTDMSIAAGSTARATPIRPASWFYVVLVVLGGIMAVVFWVVAATPYFAMQRETFGQNPEIYWPRRVPLLIHIAGGSLALLLGPINLWLGETRRRLPWHRKLGFGYLCGVAIGTVAAFYLSFTTPLGLTFATGLFSLGRGLDASRPGMAFLAISRRAIVQHREWMIRSYVVTLAFVFFRIWLRGDGGPADRHRARASRRGGVVLLRACRSSHRDGAAVARVKA